LYNSTSFSQKEKEYIFYYVSKKNNCNQCYVDHLKKANALGFKIESFDSTLIDLVDKLMEDFSYYTDAVDAQLILQIKCIIAFARFANAMNDLEEIK
jgi:AhpD family alkylhydroperoxidase